MAAVETNNETVHQSEHAQESEKEKCSAFLIGPAGRDVYNTMTLTEEETDKIDVLFDKFEEYCKPKQNVTIERYHFNTRTQSKEETIDQYVLELRLIAKNCAFGNLEEELIRDRIVCGTCSEDVRQRLLRVDDLTLEKAISICRADAESKKSAQYISETSAEVFGRRQKSGTRHNTNFKFTRKPSEEPAQRKRVCGKCGIAHPRKQCPAYGKQCLKVQQVQPFCEMLQKPSSQNRCHRTDRPVWNPQ